MVRCRRTSNTESIPSTYYLQGKTVVDIVSKQCDHLSHQLQLIDQLIETKKRTYFDKAELELVHSRPRIQNQIKVLNKLKKRFNSEPAENHRALNIVTQLLLDLDEKLALISEGEEYLGLGKSLLESQHNALCCKSKVVHRIDILERIFKEISMAQLPFFRAKLDRDIAVYEWPPLLLRLRGFKGFAEIYEYFRLVDFEVPLLSELRKMRGIIFFYLFNIMMTMTSHEGESLDKTSGEWAIEWTVESPVEESMSDSLQECEKEAKCSVTLKEDSAENCKTESTDKGCNAIRNLNFSLSMYDSEIRDVIKYGTGISEILPGVEPIRVCREARIPKFSAKKYGIVLRESMRRDCKLPLDKQLDKQLYLCINNGYEIFWLDLKQSIDQSFNNAQDVPFLPKLATLNLIEERQPLATVGLFKWRSLVYMISGKVQKSLVDMVRSPNPGYRCCASGKWLCFIRELYKGGSARDIHLLSLSEDGTSSSHSKSHIFASLNKQKLWPRVEKINGQLHLIDCPRRRLAAFDSWTFSHDVFYPNSCKWIEILAPMKDVLYIDTYLVVGDNIFAISPMGLLFESHSSSSYLMFESKTQVWVKCCRKGNSDYIENVWDIIKQIYVVARCAPGRYEYRNPSKPLHVIIAMKMSEREGEDGVCVFAYLVTSKGTVVCYQVLRNFFTGPIWPRLVSDAQLIDVEAGEGKSTMCSTVIATTWEDYKCHFSEYVFINTFTVKELNYAASVVGQLLTEGSNAWPVEQEFVAVEFKNKCIYKKGFESEEDLSCWPGIQTCFL